jgi:chromosomal replication initiator protein
MFLARELTPLSLAEIARRFNRDHSTVLHATRAVAERLEPGSETADAIHRTRTRLRAAPAADPPQSTDRPSRPPDDNR